MKRRIETMENHYILCGFGRVGQQVAKELASEKENFVILERDENKIKSAKELGWPYLTGDVAVDEDMFEKAQIKRAKGVIIAVGTDADAIFMAISAKSLNPDVFLVARASNVEAADKLTKIGVNRVALPYQIGGYHMATMAIRPSVVDFLDLLVDEDREELEMEEFVVLKDGYYDGKTIADADIVKAGLAILAIRRLDGKAIINPTRETKLHGGDRLVMMGAEAKLDLLSKEVNKRQPEMKDSKVELPPQAMDIKPAHIHKEE